VRTLVGMLTCFTLLLAAGLGALAITIVIAVVAAQSGWPPFRRRRLP
jgi:hypothetical protein